MQYSKVSENVRRWEGKNAIEKVSEKNESEGNTYSLWESNIQWYNQSEKDPKRSWKCDKNTNKNEKWTKKVNTVKQSKQFENVRVTGKDGESVVNIWECTTSKCQGELLEIREFYWNSWKSEMFNCGYC